MSITYNNNKASFDSVIYEDEVVPFRDYLQEKASEELTFDFKDCDDIHLAILQLVMAYKKNYKCNYVFGKNIKIFETLLKGFDASENHCN